MATNLDFKFRGACIEPDVTYGHDLHHPTSETQACQPQIARAKQVCGGCPVQYECRKYALSHPVQGIWGGMTEEERRSARAANIRRRSKRTARTTPAAATAQADVEAVA